MGQTPKEATTLSCMYEGKKQKNYPFQIRGFRTYFCHFRE